MKNFLFALCFTAAVLHAAVSCDQSDICPAVPQVGQELSENNRICEFQVNAGFPGTRTITATSDENTVSDVQAYVFRKTGGDDDGILDAYAKSSGSSVSLKCPVGPKTVYVLVNAPEVSSISSLSELTSTLISMENDSRTKFQMVGKTETTLSKTTSSVDINVFRFVSRVRVSGIKFEMEGDAYAGSSLVPKAFYIVNASYRNTVDRLYVPVAADFVNKAGYSASSFDNFLYSPISGVTLDENNSTYTVQHTLYTYANSHASTTGTTPWTPCCTRLVLEAELDGVTYYYPVNLMGLQPNYTYEISTLTITRHGSKSPDVPVEFSNFPINLTVKDWFDVDITSGISI